MRSTPFHERFERRCDEQRQHNRNEEPRRQIERCDTGHHGKDRQRNALDLQPVPAGISCEPEPPRAPNACTSSAPCVDVLLRFGWRLRLNDGTQGHQGG